MIKLNSNWKKVMSELDRLEKAPMRAKGYLDAVLEAGFKATQASVHVVTGSLKSSGQSSSEMKDDNTWEGEISYGGISAGVNNPVTYAIYEKARDADHDFMAVLEGLDSMYVRAILKALNK